MVQEPSNTLSSPEDRANLWEWLSFSFVQPILDLAVKRSRRTSTKSKTKQNSKVTLTPPDEERDHRIQYRATQCIHNLEGHMPSAITKSVPDIIPKSAGATSSLVAGPLVVLDNESHLSPSTCRESTSNANLDSSRSVTGSKTLSAGELGDDEASGDEEDTEKEDDIGKNEKRMLHEDDVWSLPPTFLHRNLFTKFLEEKKKLGQVIPL